MTDRYLGYGRQLIEDDDIEAVVAVLHGDFLTQGSAVGRFEEALAARVGVRHAVAVSSGTAALHLACLAADVQPGTTGVTSALTFVATANALLYCGGRADLVDIDPSTLCLAPEALAARLAAAPEVSVVLPVHFGGATGPAEELRAISGGRVVIEDASHALGSTYPGGEPVGGCAHADMAVFSFHPVKSITTGEGGAITTNDDELARRLRMLRNHGIEREIERFITPSGERGGPFFYEQQTLGFNYRMNDIQAALGCSQLRKLDRFVARRRELASRYDEAFVGLPSVDLVQRESRARSALHLYVLAIDYVAIGLTRAEVMGGLVARGIGSQVHYIPIHRQPFHADRFVGRAADFPATEAYFQRCLSLPLHPGLSDAEADRVVDAVRAVLKGG